MMFKLLPNSAKLQISQKNQKFQNFEASHFIYVFIFNQSKSF